jgi:hypothetical protein
MPPPPPPFFLFKKEQNPTGKSKCPNGEKVKNIKDGETDQ